MNRVIITVVGKDTTGIIAAVCTYLAEKKFNVLDISQTIVDGFFNMMMIVDMENALASFEEMSDSLDEVGEILGVRVLAQKEEIFDKMHRV